MAKIENFEQFITEFEELKKTIDEIVSNLKSTIQNFIYSKRNNDEMMININPEESNELKCKKYEGTFDKMDETNQSLKHMLESENKFKDLCLRIHNICNQLKERCLLEQEQFAPNFNKIIEDIRVLMNEVYKDPTERQNQLKTIEAAKIQIEAIQKELNWRIQLKKEMEENEKEKEEMKQKIQTLETQNVKQQNEIRQCRNDNQYLQTNYNNQITQLNNTIESQNTKINNMQSTIKSKENTNESLKQEIKSKSTQIDGLQRTKSTQEDEIRKLRNKLQPLDIYFNMNSTDRERIEHWTEKSFHSVIFDSNVMNCTKSSSQFGEKILNKSQLLFLIEDTNGRKFGGFVKAKISSLNSWIYDNEAFVFTLVNNSSIRPEKFICKNASHAFMSSLRNTPNFLFLMGGKDSPFTGDDITLRKSDDGATSYCNQRSYSYTKPRDSLIGTRDFYMKRLLVIQMV